MSRIFEALQRAERERKPISTADGESPSDARLSYQIGEMMGPPAQFSLDAIEQVEWKPQLESFPALAQAGPCLEQFRSLRSRIYEANAQTPFKTLLISSGCPSEGKSFVSINLAVSLARNREHNVLLIDGDLRRPSLHERFGVANTKGLTDYLAGETDLRSIMVRGTSYQSETGKMPAMENFALIPSGPCRDNAAELISNHRVEALVAELAPHFQWIIIDSPPITVVTDAADLSRATDAVLLVGRQGQTKFSAAKAAHTAFAHSRVLGFVLNDAVDLPQTDSYYGYYYGNGDDSKHPKSRSDKRKG